MLLRDTRLKALILAGGFGTRLRPLSCTRPKLLFPVMNKPILDWTLERLAKGGVKEVILAVNYMAENLMQHCGNSKYEMRILYSKEDSPLGTGGPVKNAEKLIGHEEPFLVLNGDILTNMDYTELVEKHSENDTIATITLCEVDDPSRFGIAKLTEEKRIIRFIEKPAREKAPTNPANAGIYVFDPEIFDYIPGDRPVSIERETFPILTREGKLYGHHFRGNWIDTGKLADYIKANHLFLDLYSKENRLRGNVKVRNQAEIEEPSVIGDEVTIRGKSKIGPYATIGDHIKLGREVHIENSIIFSNTLISDFASIRGAVIGEGVVIGKRVKIKDGCVIGDRTIIRDNVTLSRDVIICPFKDVSESVLAPKCLM
jgi:mannose-1-phosphate guanylyltransferase